MIDGRLFDAPAFNERLFFPRKDTTKLPARARDLDIQFLARGCIFAGTGPERRIQPCFFFHGNGEVVADYDDAAAAFSHAGVRSLSSTIAATGEAPGHRRSVASSKTRPWF
ncbi:MAG TPA: hypothetical protein VHZ73_03055 [Vicinamibacterales bacterium]|jgi:hypothetical protein|nr:hypothetical protein [Vicinamibacterales bacterium]